VLCVLCCPSPAYAQATWQAWADATILRVATERLRYAIDAEPKSELTAWVSVETTPHVAYAVTPLLDVVGEVNLEIDNHRGRANGLTVTPRVGAQLHALSRIIGFHSANPDAGIEPRPRRRLDLGSLLRLERQLRVSGDPAAGWRFRDRCSAAYPLNRMKTTADGAISVTSDIEAFVPLASPVRGGRISHIRIRNGVGYRRNFAWRFQMFYVVDTVRNTLGAMEVRSQAIDVLVTRAF